MPVGRDVEVAKISPFWRASAGPRVLLIEGEAGIEKTTLLSAVQLEMTVLSACPVESEVAVPGKT